MPALSCVRKTRRIEGARAIHNDGRYPTAKRGWYAVGFLLFAYTLSFIDRQILSLMVDPIKRDLDLTDTQFALMHGPAFAVFYTVFGLPLGRLVDQASRRSVIAAGMFTWSLMTAFCGLAQTYAQLLFARMGVGVGEAALSPAAYSILSDYFPPDRLTRPLAVYSLGISIGAGLAFIAGGWIIAAVANLGAMDLPLVGAMRPWQVVFLVVGLPGIAFAALSFSMREPVRKGLSGDGKALPLREVGGFLLSRRKVFVRLFGGLAVMTGMGHGVMAWLPAYFIRIHEWTISEFAWSFGLVLLVFGSAGIYAGSLVADYFHRNGHRDGTVRAACVGAAGAIPFAVAAPLATDATVSLALFALFEFFLMMPWGVAAVTVPLITPNRLRGQISALYLLIINLVGLGLGPPAVAAITDFVFGDEAMVGQSLFWFSVVTGPVGLVLLISSLQYFRAETGRAREWSEHTAPTGPAKETRT